jgi:hypothetical protein
MKNIFKKCSSKHYMIIVIFFLRFNFQYLFNEIQLYYKNKLELLKWVV